MNNAWAERSLDHPKPPVQAAFYRASRLGATILTCVFFLSLAFWVRHKSHPGPSVELQITSPGIREVLPLGKLVTLNGIVNRGSDTVCNGIPVRTDKLGRFTLELPGPLEGGLFSIECRSMNPRGREFAFRFGRIAGGRAPLTQELNKAFKLQLPLDHLEKEGSLFSPLNRIVKKELTERINLVGSRLAFRLGAVSFGGVSVEKTELRDISSDSKGRLVMKIEIKGFCFRAKIVTTRLPVALGSMQKLSRALERERKLCIPVTISADAAMGLKSSQEPQIKIGPLDSSALASIGALKNFADSDLLQHMITEPVKAALTWVGEEAESLLDKMRFVFKELDRNLSSLADILPPAPKEFSAKRPRVCFDVKLSRLEIQEETKTLLVEAGAAVTGYTLHEASCSAASLQKSFPEHAFRVTTGPGSRDPVHSSAFLFPENRPIVGVSLDLINAYLRALWYAGGLGRPLSLGTLDLELSEGIPVSLPQAERAGFDIRRINLDNPPILTTPDGETLLLSMAESEVLLETVGEPRRLFRINGRIPLRLDISFREHLRLNIERTAPFFFSLRCIGESGGNPCTQQSRRYESLAQTGVELIQSGDIFLPGIVLWKIRPLLETDQHTVKISSPRVTGGYITTEITTIHKKALKDPDAKLPFSPFTLFK